MSMIGELRMVPAAALAALTAPATRGPALRALMDGDGVCLDKRWEVLTHVLEAATGQDTLGWVGLPLDWTDTGYGPPLLISVDEVREVAAVLDGLDDAAVVDAFDPDALAHEGLYCPPPTSEPERGEYLAELVTLVGAVRRLFSEAAAAGHGALHYLT